MNTAAVGISEVSKRLGSHPALTAVSLVVPPGGAVVILVYWLVLLWMYNRRIFIRL